MSDYNSLMEARIQFGDNVIVFTTEEDGSECTQKATVINVPQGEGDLWQFQGFDGVVFALNPYHSSFVGMEKVSSG